MLGAIIGDIVGSVWEFHRIKTKRFELFGDKNGITDDSILTVAVADALLHDRDPAEAMRDWARRVKPGRHVAGYGKRFINWVAAPSVQPPYGSYGNGGAMRVSPAAFLANSLEDCLDKARRVTEVTHNHPEGMKGALATAHAIWLARQGEPANAIRLVLSETYGYDMHRSVDEIRAVHVYNETAAGCVPEALTCALEAKDFEDAIRNAVSLGGDADTLAAIAGGLAEALFGIPAEIRARGEEYLPKEMLNMVQAYEIALSIKEKSMAKNLEKPKFDAVEILINAAKHLNCNLTALVAETAFWANPGIHKRLQRNGSIAWYPNIRRARKGDNEKKGQVIDGVRLDDNTYANTILKRALGNGLVRFEGFEACHIWPSTCYDVRYHTALANLVLLPRALAGLTDHDPDIQAALQYHAFELYDWHPEETVEPKMPLNYPDCWRDPERFPSELRFPNWANKQPEPPIG